jgi:uncharacterized Zn finger protein
VLPAAAQGSELDEKPQLLFVLRGVDENELIASAGTDLPLSAAPSAAVLDHGDVAALFGLEMTETASSDAPASPERPGRTKATKVGKARAESKTRAANEPNAKAAKQNSSLCTSRTNSEPKWVALVRARKRRARRRRDRAA